MYKVIKKRNTKSMYNKVKYRHDSGRGLSAYNFFYLEHLSDMILKGHHLNSIYTIACLSIIALTFQYIECYL